MCHAASHRAQTKQNPKGLGGGVVVEPVCSLSRSVFSVNSLEAHKREKSSRNNKKKHTTARAGFFIKLLYAALAGAGLPSFFLSDSGSALTIQTYQ